MLCCAVYTRNELAATTSLRAGAFGAGSGPQINRIDFSLTVENMQRRNETMSKEEALLPLPRRRY
jgi:hypothetical protein